jgi:hypothetical protein
MQVIPLNTASAQILSIQLARQSCRLKVYQKTFGLYVDLYVNDVLIIAGQSAHNLVRLVRDAYLGFTGDLVFYDTAGASDPSHDGLSGRFVLLYLPAT